MDQIVKKMLSLAKTAQARAYAPYSKFHVGCCIQTTNGNFYSGCNVENSSYSLTACAEVGAISNMIANGEQQIASLVVIGSGDQICTPCGACRQRILEFSEKGLPIHMFNQADVHQTLSLEELLPHAFGKHNLENYS